MPCLTFAHAADPYAGLGVPRPKPGAFAVCRLRMSGTLPSEPPSSFSLACTQEDSSALEQPVQVALGEDLLKLVKTGSVRGTLVAANIGRSCHSDNTPPRRCARNTAPFSMP